MDTILSAWDIVAPTNLRPQAGGINNETRFVETPAGNYILRIYGATRDLAKIRFELAVMTELNRLGLPFAVPAPVPSRSGDPVVLTEAGAPATLVPVIPGAQPPFGDFDTAFPIGQALGELTRAFGQVRAEAPPGWQLTYGDLAPFPDIDPSAVPGRAPVEPDKQARLERLVREMREQVPTYYATLPRQIIHGDFVPANLLVDRGRVTAVLDFELAQHDLRALDLAMALAAWGSGRWNTGTEWEILEAFCRGYFSRMTLLPVEIEALPFLMRLRRCVVFLHMTGRHLRGEAPVEIALHGAEGALKIEDWLERNSGELVSRVSAWAK